MFFYRFQELPLENTDVITGVEQEDGIVDLLNVSIGRLSPLPLILMSALVSHLSELPIETLEQIFLYLPGQDIIKMEAVSRRFRDVFRDSPALQYQRNPLLCWPE
ncbi:hypothetical protein BDM02DRAFT_1993637 [Thelephora ganbajun]|uniref:Uncharacterized protein n=1 Tax=Thelephora ganbajun TaxID=370292 RepID=A0ACB6ZHV0_THEGA|nr:hypothetical protein BDM02DRAFT_1993637 [Thelephora ganbajun]